MEYFSNLNSYSIFWSIIPPKNFIFLLTKKEKNDSLVSNIVHISEFEKQSEFSRKHFLRKSCLANFKIKVLLKNFIQRAFFSYSITFSRVQTDISINFCFCFCFYSFGRKNKSLNYAKFLLIAFKGRERAYLSYYSRNPLKS